MRIALVTTASVIASGEDIDLEPVSRALALRGVDVSTEFWDDDHVNWSGFDAVLMRSPWDYSYRIDEFLAWLRQVSELVTVANCQHIIEWNLDKRYLLDLSEFGVPVVPTRFARSHDDATEALASTSAMSAELVVKPSVSAGSRDTGRFRSGDGQALELAYSILQSGRTAMIQPAIESVASVGESALLYFDGTYSHAVTKGPILDLGGILIGGEYEERIRALAPGAGQLAVGDSALAAISEVLSRSACNCDSDVPLYARIDVVKTADGYALLEAELFEPSYFVDFAPGAVDRFAESVLRRF